MSRTIADLEGHLKMRLPVRGRRKLLFADVGRDDVESCQEIIADIAEAERRTSDEYPVPQGDLIIRVPMVLERRFR